MTIAHDAQTRFPSINGTTGVNSVDTTTGNRTFSHVAGASPRGVVLVLCSTGTTSTVTGVLYGGVAMTLSATATDTSEAGRVDIYTLTDQSVPGGTQTVTLQGCTATGKWATCSTVTAATPHTHVHTTGVVNTTTGANPTVNLTTTAPTLAYGGVHDGAAAPATAVGTGCTLQHSNDYGALSANTLRRTGQDAAGTVTLTATFGSDDHCMAAVALEEWTVASPELELSGWSITGPGASDTIQSVAVAINVYASAAGLGVTYELWDGATAQIGTTRTGVLTTDSSFVDTVSWTGVTYAQLATLRLRIRATSPTSGATVNVDWSSLTITHVPAVGDTPIAVADTATAADALAASVTTTIADTGSSVDASAVTVTTGPGDTGVAVDAAAVTVALTLADAATATDGISVSAGGSTPVALTETATATDTVTATATTTLADTATAGDQTGVTTTTTAVDAATAADTINVTGRPGPGDTGAGADAVGVAAATTAVDAATATDTLTLAATTGLADTGAAVDGISVSAGGPPPVTLADTATAADALGVTTVALPLADTATAADALTRPSAGTTPRPSAGMTSRPSAGTTPRPSAGMTSRP